MMSNDASDAGEQRASRATPSLVVGGCGASGDAATARPADESVRGVNGTTGHELTDGEDEANMSAADKDFKPVFLKGLFRSSLPRE